MRFLLTVIDHATNTGTEAERVAVDAFNDRLRAAGALVFAGGLEAPPQAVVIDARAGEPTRTPGPFAPSREYQAGFWIIDAPTREAALALATEGSRACGRRVEVRAVLGGGTSSS